MNYNSNIDDEFASLFLQELQNSKSNLSLTPNQNPNEIEIDYLNSIEFNTNAQQLNSTGPASYARYLPLETTTFSSSIFDFNEFQYPVENIISRSSSTFNISHLPMNSSSNNHKAETKNPTENNMNHQKTENINNQSTDTKFNQDLNILIPNCPNLPNDNVVNKVVGEDEYNVLLNIAEKVLSLESIEQPSVLTMQNENNNPISLSFSGQIGGRLYISPETLNKYPDFGSGNNTQLSQLFCYRRNSINIKLQMNFEQLENLFIDGNLIDKLSIELSSSLIHSKQDLNITNVIKDREEFTFPNQINDVHTNKKCLRINESKRIFTIKELLQYPLQNNSLEFVWEQIKFSSATANNRHDANNKFYKIIVEVKLLNNADDTLLGKQFESKNIIVRGRNPSFYSQKGDILIGNIKRKTKTKTKVIHESKTPKTSTTNTLKRKCDETIDPIPVFENEITTNPINKEPKEEELQKDDIEDSKSPTPSLLFDEQPEQDDSNNSSSSSSSSSSYQYFKVEDNYYLPPVDVGYFPHHVHHNKQVFKITSTNLQHGVEKHKQYNYYI